MENIRFKKNTVVSQTCVMAVEFPLYILDNLFGERYEITRVHKIEKNGTCTIIKKTESDQFGDKFEITLYTTDDIEAYVSKFEYLEDNIDSGGHVWSDLMLQLTVFLKECKLL